MSIQDLSNEDLLTTLINVHSKIQTEDPYWKLREEALNRMGNQEEIYLLNALMLELKGSWPQFEHYRNRLNEIRKVG